MTLQEKIQKKAEGFGKLAPTFLEGAKFTLKNQWISVKEDLPCNHEELIENEIYTKNVLVVFAWNNDPSKRHIGICDMCNKIGSFNTNWYWWNPAYYHVVYWMPLPELPIELQHLIKDQCDTWLNPMGYSLHFSTPTYLAYSNDAIDLNWPWPLIICKVYIKLCTKYA